MDDDQSITITKAQLEHVLGEATSATTQRTVDATVQALRDAGWLREKAGHLVTVKQVVRNEQGQITKVIETAER